MLKIREMRQAARLTQNEFASAIGYSPSAICMWETGERRPPADKLPLIAKVLNCTVNDLFDSADEPA